MLIPAEPPPLKPFSTLGVVFSFWTLKKLVYSERIEANFNLPSSLSALKNVVNGTMHVNNRKLACLEEQQ